MIHRYAPAAAVAVMAGLCLAAWQGWVLDLVTWWGAP